jgi:hypothetical protein
MDRGASPLREDQNHTKPSNLATQSLKSGTRREKREKRETCVIEEKGRHLNSLASLLGRFRGERERSSYAVVDVRG